MPVDTDDELRAILDCSTIAVVGCSTTPGKAAHDVPKFLAEQGYEILPVNPYADEVLGTPAVDSLVDIEADVDVVDVFRPSEEVPDIVDDLLRWGGGDVLWLQLGITHDEALARADDAGYRTVQDRCLKVEYQRLVGE